MVSIRPPWPIERLATAATPAVNLIDGDRLCDLVEQQGIGIRAVPTVIEDWFDRFDRLGPSIDLTARRSRHFAPAAAAGSTTMTPPARDCRRSVVL
jgi:hypothetical protein